ncbi:AbrB/MazE/SpoVT family DNA-binding domain-containing protein [Candidatus Babeliales bacterium]|nr:AbrB/MazE/SpoVT family DNA-binding domain-containing protein [Candidatus Babeliales bacterium]
MLKKLVRYGNSNALVLDKAILELLNIAEGSVVKISTDGKSIILTPYQSITPMVQETVTSAEAMRFAQVQESIKVYKNLSEEQKSFFTAELLALTKKHAELMMSLGYHEQLQKELQDAKIACAGDQIAFMERYKNLIAKHVPEISALQEKILAIHNQCRVLSGDQSIQNVQNQQLTIEKHMAEIFAKHKATQVLFGNVMNSEEYQHRAQLIAEKYQNNQKSSEFMKEMKQLMYEFCPEMEQLHQDLEVVAQKYDLNTL